MRQILAETTSAPIVQRALQVSQPGDRWEREADEMADEVMRMQDPGLSDTRGWGVVQRCPDGTCSPDDEAKHVMRLTDPSSATADSSGLTATALGRLGTGRPLSSGERAFFERRFNRDFSHVRINDTTEAAKTARSIQALAFTSGHRIALGAHSYQPGSRAGRRLLAHELSHAVQQGAAKSIVKARK